MPVSFLRAVIIGFVLASASVAYSGTHAGQSPSPDTRGKPGEAMASPSADSLSAGQKAATASGEGENEFGVLFVADGVEATYDACSSCHSERIVAQQGLTHDEWDELLEWMVEEQGMSELEADERDIILGYLSTHYNIDRPNMVRN